MSQISLLWFMPKEKIKRDFTAHFPSEIFEFYIN